MSFLATIKLSSLIYAASKVTSLEYKVLLERIRFNYGNEAININIPNYT